MLFAVVSLATFNWIFTFTWRLPVDCSALLHHSCSCSELQLYSAAVAAITSWALDPTRVSHFAHTSGRCIVLECTRHINPYWPAWWFPRSLGSIGGLSRIGSLRTYLLIWDTSPCFGWRNNSDALCVGSRRPPSSPLTALLLIASDVSTRFFG